MKSSALAILLCGLAALPLLYVSTKAGEKSAGVSAGISLYKKPALKRDYWHTRDMVHITWSDSKSFTNALYGIAVKEGRLKPGEPAWKYSPSLNRGRSRRDRNIALHGRTFRCTLE